MHAVGRVTGPLAARDHHAAAADGACIRAGARHGEVGLLDPRPGGKVVAPRRGPVLVEEVARAAVAPAGHAQLPLDERAAGVVARRGHGGEVRAPRVGRDGVGVHPAKGGRMRAVPAAVAGDDVDDAVAQHGGGAAAAAPLRQRGARGPAVGRDVVRVEGVCVALEREAAGPRGGDVDGGAGDDALHVVDLDAGARAGAVGPGARLGVVHADGLVGAAAAQQHDEAAHHDGARLVALGRRAGRDRGRDPAAAQGGAGRGAARAQLARRVVRGAQPAARDDGLDAALRARAPAPHAAPRAAARAAAPRAAR